MCCVLQGRFRSCCLNEELVKMGFAKVHHVDGLAGDRLYYKFSNKLLKHELYAEKKGKGVWKPPPRREVIKEYFNEKYHNLTSPVYRFLDKMPWKRKKKWSCPRENYNHLCLGFLIQFSVYAWSFFVGCNSVSGPRISLLNGDTLVSFRSIQSANREW